VLVRSARMAHKLLWLRQCPPTSQKAALDVIGNEGVELLHRHGAALTTGLALTGFGRAGVVPVASSLPGPQRHGLAAGGAEADAGKEGGTAHDPSVAALTKLR
jgi:hypothetical protein